MLRILTRSQPACFDFTNSFFCSIKLQHWWAIWKILKSGTVLGLSVGFHFLSNPSKQITIICLKNTTRYIQVSLYRKTVGLLENSYRKRALEPFEILYYFFPQQSFSREGELYSVLGEPYHTFNFALLSPHVDGEWVKFLLHLKISFF